MRVYIYIYIYIHIYIYVYIYIHTYEQTSEMRINQREGYRSQEYILILVSLIYKNEHLLHKENTST